jgi:hypothetical protein
VRPRARHPFLVTIARGLAAGVLGTLAMDLVWFSRYRRGGGDSAFGGWEWTSGLDSWDGAPAPALMGKKVLEAVSGREVPAARASALNNAMHWGYGTSWTAGYALLRRHPRWWHGLAFGGLVWASDYVTLPLAGVYEPIWRNDADALAQDLSAHLVFGVAADGALRLLSRR